MDKKLDIPPYIFITAPPILRNYIKLERHSEVDLDYELFPKKIERRDEIIPSREIIQDQPGYCGTAVLNMIPSRLVSHIFPHYEEPPKSICTGGFTSDVLKKIDVPLESDKFSESDSDTQNKLKMKV